jgi:hypothetical protein
MATRSVGKANRSPHWLGGVGGNLATLRGAADVKFDDDDIVAFAE